jgi:hypothetical protein
VVDSLQTDYKAPANATSPARIQVSLVVRTGHPDSNRFVVESLDRWLVDHAEREGVPYKILPSVPSWSQIAQVTIGEGPVDRTAQLYDPSLRNRPGARDRGRDGGGRRVIETLDDEFAPGQVTITGTPQPPPPRAGERAWSSTSQALEKLAPLPEGQGGFPLGTTVTTFSLIWTVELTPATDGGGA